MSINFNRIAAAAIATAFAAPAFAGTLVGGGATFPAEAYFGKAWIVAGNSANDQRLANSSNGSPEAGSLFASVSSAVSGGSVISYCQMGSGFGRNMLAGVIPSAANACPSTFSVAVVNSSSSTQGFSGTSSEADFAGSDAPMSSTDFNTAVTNKGATRGQLVQFPSAAGAIAVVYNNSAVAAGKFKITEATLCKIWNGTYTNWNQINAAYASLPITLVYRADSSGTSFNFANHLNWVCGSPYFSVTQTFGSAFPSGVPAGAVSASGNPGVVEKVLATSGAIGYGDFADAKAHGATQWALIAANGSTVYKDPGKNAATFALPTSVTNLNGTSYNAVTVDTALNGNDATFKRPLGTTALAAAPNGKAGCVYTIDPAAFATAPLKVNSTTGTLLDYTIYPIMAPTYLLGYYKGNGSNLIDMQTLLGATYNSVTKGTTTTIGSSTGWSYFKAVTPAATGKKLTTATISACVAQ